MTALQRRYLLEVRRIVRRHVPAKAGRAWLIGSWARDRISPASDLDVAVRLAPKTSAARLAALEEALEASTVPYRVDIVNLRMADAAFREKVAVEGIPWVR